MYSTDITDEKVVMKDKIKESPKENNNNNNNNNDDDNSDNDHHSWNSLTNSNRDKPYLDPSIWENLNDREDLAIYIDWHARHPHCSSPREINDDGTGQTIKDEMIKWNDESLKLKWKDFSHYKPKTPGQMFEPVMFGLNANFDEASVIAMEDEFNEQVEYQEETGGNLNFNLSVKDELSISHYSLDEDDPANKIFIKNSIKGREIEKLKKEYASKQVLIKQSSERKKRGMANMLALSINETPSQYNQRHIIHAFKPFFNNVGNTKYTEGGELMTNFYKKERQTLVNLALKEYHDPTGMLNMISMNKNEKNNNEKYNLNNTIKNKKSVKYFSKRKDKRKNIKENNNNFISMNGEKNTNKNKTNNIIKLPHINGIKKSISGIFQHSEQNIVEKKNKKKLIKNNSSKYSIEELDNMAHEWINYADKIRNKIERNQKGILPDFRFNFSNTIDEEKRNLDLIDACMRGSVMRVLALLIMGADAESLYEESPLIFAIMRHIISLDKLSGHTNLEDPDDTERLRFIKVLKALINYGATVNILCPQEHLAPLHIAALNGNSKLTLWLIKSGKVNDEIDIESGPSSHCQTPLMFAAKYGYVQVIAILLKSQSLIDKQDNEGNTALHHAAQYGQSRTCRFLLRVGSSRLIKNNNGEFAADIATKAGFLTCAHVIMTFAQGQFKAMPMIKYLESEDFYNTNDSSGTVTDVVATKLKHVGKLLGNTSGILSKFSKKLSNFFHGQNSKNAEQQLQIQLKRQSEHLNL